MGWRERAFQGRLSIMMGGNARDQGVGGHLAAKGRVCIGVVGDSKQFCPHFILLNKPRYLYHGSNQPL